MLERGTPGGFLANRFGGSASPRCAVTVDPDHRLVLMSAIAAYTTGSAHVNHLDDTGSIRPGMLADLVVLDRDPFGHPTSDIADTLVEATYVEGVCAYRRP
ncbi:hypothetical protein GCM10027169_23080 [Gordonia jinhuaensis]|uniref:Amidohydrolase 3 domain-containing protein n=1 Tax=Gordonia jinhuaensis TaxID=1517702 RepID=A0A916WYX4_9ACTN|nr:amidohydrolase family protein [Gordonia jinhuaensis]GGB40866.1 hypothetical protein GCM10011489_30540 [Gordonia jinhuaensis]